MVKIKRFQDGGFVWLDLDPADSGPAVVEKRKEERQTVRLPAKLNGNFGYFVTNMADSALYLETAYRHRVGELVSLEIELDLQEGRRLLVAQGQVRRIESDDDRLGVVVELISRRLEPVEQ